MGWGFTFTAGLAQTKNGPSPFTPPVGSTPRRCGHWREAPAQHPADDPYAWDHRADTYLTEVERFLFNVLLFLGSLPERIRTRPGIAGRPRKEGALEAGVAGRPLPGQGGLPAGIPSDRSEHQPTGRKLPDHWRAGHWRRQAFGEGSLHGS